MKIKFFNFCFNSSYEHCSHGTGGLHQMGGRDRSRPPQERPLGGRDLSRPPRERPFGGRDQVATSRDHPSGVDQGTTRPAHVSSPQPTANKEKIHKKSSKNLQKFRHPQTRLNGYSGSAPLCVSFFFVKWHPPCEGQGGGTASHWSVPCFCMASAWQEPTECSGVLVDERKRTKTNICRSSTNEIGRASCRERV